MKTYKKILIVIGLVLSFGFVLAPATVGAFDPITKSCTETDPTKVTELCKQQALPENQLPAIIKITVNTLLYVLAAISVLVIIISGIYYTTSGGNTANVTRAKNTLLYAVIGLVVAILAYAIVNFVITTFTATPSSTSTTTTTP